MAYEFFLSYARANDSPYLRQFFDDLSKELRDQLELNNKNHPVGFFDQSDIELGDEWEQTIRTALQESRVMVCVYSPKYFESTYCGKEWRFFQMRREAFRDANTKAGQPAPPLPPTIKPVLWLPPLPASLHADLGATHYALGDLKAEYNTEGLRYILLKKNDYGSLYTNYIYNLAKSIKEAGTYQMPSLTPVPSLKDIVSAFAPVAAQAAAAPAPVAAAPPRKIRHVRFVFVAGNPDEFDSTRAKDAYLDSGGGDWRPFYPQATTRIHALVHSLVTDDELDFKSDELPLTARLREEVEKAYDERKIVIILVDAWTVKWKPEYQQILHDFDRDLKASTINCCVLVPWNSTDGEIQDEREAIEQTVKDTFDIRANIWKNPLFFRHAISSIDDLKDALRNVLTQIRAEMQKRVDSAKPVPASIPKPSVSNEPQQSGTGV